MSTSEPVQKSVESGVNTDSAVTENRYLVYQIGNETYGTPLLDIREVVQYQTPKFMPNMESYFVGVINIRGSVVGVVDLRLKFKQPAEITKSTALLVCVSEFGPIAAIVDKVISVVAFGKQDIEQKPPVVTQVDQSYLLGVAKMEQGLVTLIHLQNTLGQMKLIQHSA